MNRGSGRTVSVWMNGEDFPRFAPLARDLEADVCIVGAGIAGLSVAYQLAKQGRQVVVLEDGDVGSGETSRTTAHLVNAFDDRYHVVERLHGTDAARLVAQSHTQAIEAIEQVVRAERIDCDFERVDGYLFVPPGETADELEHEFHACRRAGLTQVVWADRAPFPGFDTGRCLKFPRQGQFHPMRYLAGLARATVAAGGRIFTGTHAATIESGRGKGRARVQARGTGSNGASGSVVTADHVVVATNTPVQDLLKLHTKQYPYRTYVIAARVPAGSVTRALYWDTPHPYHYVRLQGEGDHDLLIVGGEDHKTGQAHDAEERYRRLEKWARERFPMMGGIEYEWSGQVIEPMDSLAYIGRNPGDEDVWVVTGDSGNGMTHGTIAGLLLAALIEGREHPWAKLYNPARKSLRAALEFTKENLNMAAQYRSWLTAGDVASESEIARGCGAVLRDGARKIAVYRDRHGELHRMSAVCPHLGAIVTWNGEECTWDCPAHGSRFDAEGHVVNGPANADLPRAHEHAEPGRS